MATKSKYTEDWIPVKSIYNGMIELDDKTKLTGVKIVPRNIFILDEQSQQNIIYRLKNFYDTIDYEFWLMVADRPVDISLYLSQLQLLYNNVTNNKIRKLIMQDVNKANEFAENSVVDTEYYIIFKEKNMDLMNKKVRNLITGLANCGLISSQVTNNDLRMLLDNFLNGGNTSDFGTVMPL